MNKSHLEDNLDFLVKSGSITRGEAEIIQRAGGVMPTGYTTEPSRKNKNADTLVYEADGKKHYLHSRFDPEEEAKRRAALLDPAIEYICITGAGLGYGVAAAPGALKSLRAILIIEKEPALLAAALRRFPLQKYRGIRWFLWVGDVSTANIERLERFMALAETGQYENIVNAAFEAANELFSERMKHSLRMRSHRDVVEEMMAKCTDQPMFIPSLRSYYEQKLYEVPFPSRFRIEPTNFCNLKCRMCPSTDYPASEKGYMDPGLYEGIIDNIAENVSFEWCHILFYLGGEPLMHKQLDVMIRMAKERGFLTQINTNGALLKGDTAQRILDSGLDLVLFSFDDVTPEKYKEIRAGTTKEKVYKNIVDFLELKKRLGRRKPVTNVTALKLPAEGELIDRRAKPEPSGELKELFSGYDVQFIMYHAHHWASDYEADIEGMEPLGPLGPYFPCRLLWAEMTVRWDGTVVPCCYDLRSEEPLGRFPDEKLAQIWNGEKFTELRQAHVRGRAGRVPLCAGCQGLRGGENTAQGFGRAVDLYRKNPV